MSQLSQQSHFSDILSDVDHFMEENEITEDVDQLMNHSDLNTYNEEDEDIKPVPDVFYGTVASPSPSDTPPVHRYPPNQPTDLCSDEYPGPLNFEVLVLPNGQKTPWEYSTKLKKIYILSNMSFPVAFGVQTRPPKTRLFIRATPIFSQAQYFQETVQRCIAHQHPKDPSNKGVPPHVFRHIIRCDSGETVYCGDEKSRFNLVVPLATPQAGTDVVKEYFSFVCQNSCPSGMNRRPIEVIFTLENEGGAVLGRRVLCARICKCPKRDREKDEASLVNNNQPTHSKKRRLNHHQEQVDTKVMSLKDINIVGKQNYVQVLKFCRSLMAGEIVKMEEKNGADAPFRRCFNELNTMINQTGTE